MKKKEIKGVRPRAVSRVLKSQPRWRKEGCRKKRLTSWFTVLFIAVGLWRLCAFAAEAEWTFMVYLDGDNDLEGVAINDFLEMAAVGSDASVNIVVQFDRIGGHDSRYGDWDTCKRFYVTSGMTPTPAEQVQDIGEANMGDPATLTDFINWVAANYPANNYAVVLWNHGGGWREQYDVLMKALEMAKTGDEREEIRQALRQIRRPSYKAACWDVTNNDDCLYVKEVKLAMNAAIVDMDMVGFDACLMGMIEVAYEIKDTGASVMVGSEETVPWNGWPYDAILTDLTSNPSWTPSQLGANIVDRYYESYQNQNYWTQAAIDLGHMDTLGSALNNFADTMRNSWNTDQLGVQAAAQSVMDEVDTAVIHEHHGPSWPGSHGLAIYFPATQGQFDPDYNGTVINFPADTLWEEFLADFYTAMGGSWIEAARLASQEYYDDEHIDLYDFCEHIVNAPATPMISRSPGSLSNSCAVGTDALSQRCEVWNSGGGTLNYTISDAVTWLSCSPTSGASVGEHDAITVNYSTFKLSVGTYSATITITAEDATNSPQTIPVNLIVGVPPIANAGPDQRVNERNTVTLDGSNSTDPDDGIATYLWQQTGGTSVALSDATAVQPTFTAPDVGPDGASLTFQLTVTDNADLQSADTCIVSVTSGDGDGSCFITTAACGSAMEPHVKILRQFREHFLGLIERFTSMGPFSTRNMSLGLVP